MQLINNFFSRLNQLDKNKIFYLLTSILCGIMCALLYKGYINGLVLPIVLIFLFVLIINPDAIVFLAVIVTPFSLNLSKTSFGIGMSLPSEPIMFILFVLFWIGVLLRGGIKKEILKHPVTIFILLHLLWYTVTTICSTMPVVSIKSTLARYCYITVFYFMLLYIFEKREKINQFILAYLIPLSVVIIYTLMNQATAGFTEQNAHIAMTPYYVDHTAYAAVLAFFVPVLIGMIANKNNSKFLKFILITCLILVVTAIVLSYTRAAWVALVGALLCYFVFLLKIKEWVIYLGISSVVLFYLIFSVEINMYLEKNDKTSSTNYAAHIQSIGNISTDDSNIERLNRWSCAIRMFKTKPVIGYGPGTYMFQYGKFQKYSERSGISTNFAEGGGSHSEYLGPLTEQGILGPITFILIGAAVIIRASRWIKTSSDNNSKAMARGLLLGLITYWIHGALNYFLDTEKASVPFWGFIAALVALEIYQKKHQEQQLSTDSATK